MRKTTNEQVQKQVYFWGDIKWRTNKYFEFKRVIDEDNIIIVTKNITEVKDSLVLIVDNDKVVYLKPWQVQPIMNYHAGVYAFAVKLNRNFMKTYQFKRPFEEVYFKEEDTFDTLLESAKEQDRVNMPVATGWGRTDVEWNISRR